jgi:phage head maturation protease
MTLPTLAAPPVLPALPDLDALTRSVGVAEYDIDRVRGVVEALVVPYMRPADIIEVLPGPGGQPRVVEYREQFAAGSLDRAKAAPNRVGLTFTHETSMPNRMGYGLAVRDDTALNGGVVTFQLYRDTLDRSIELLTTSHTGMSVTARCIRPQRGTEQNGALVTREAVHLTSVAATDDPAYVDARVLAIRERQAILEAEAERTAERASQYVEGLLMLRSYGRELTPAQVAYLAEHGHPAPGA